MFYPISHTGLGSRVWGLAARHQTLNTRISRLSSLACLNMNDRHYFLGMRHTLTAGGALTRPPVSLTGGQGSPSGNLTVYRCSVWLTKRKNSFLAICSPMHMRRPKHDERVNGKTRKRLILSILNTHINFIHL